MIDVIETRQRSNKHKIPEENCLCRSSFQFLRRVPGGLKNQAYFH